MKKSIDVLMVEDNPQDAELIVHTLQSSGYKIVFERVETAKEMSAVLDKRSWDLVLSDYWQPHFNAPAALSLLQKSGQDIPFIIISGSMEADLIVSAMKAGAHDYIGKENLKRLPAVIERELHNAQLRKAQKRVQERLEYLASYNPLTNLPNQNLYSEHLKRAIKKGKREKKPVAVMMMDVDRFCDVNETLGHSYGNLLLQQLGARLVENLRDSDIVAHLGEDEFGVLLTPGDLDGAIQVAHKIEGILEKPFLIENIPIQIEMSAGIAIFPDHGEDPQDLLGKADLAVYLAKKAGSGYFIYTPESDQDAASHMALLKELRSAMELNQLVLYYQPQIDLKTLRTIGVEVLVCWQHPEQGLLPPSRFIPLAERTGLINSLFSWVLDTALSQLNAWKKADIITSISVNLSGRNLHDRLLVNKVSSQLAAHGILPIHLKLEITEGAVMADSIRAMEVLTHLKQIGVGISIDDFGTSYTSVSYLQKLPVNELKVDKSLVIGMIDREENDVMVSSISDLGRHLGLSIVGEGIENKSMLSRLVDFRFDSGQGEYFSNPLSANELTEWFRESPYGLKA